VEIKKFLKALLVEMNLGGPIGSMPKVRMMALSVMVGIKELFSWFKKKMEVSIGGSYSIFNNLFRIAILIRSALSTMTNLQDNSMGLKMSYLNNGPKSSA
jgi:hypothetical protein